MSARLSWGPKWLWWAWPGYWVCLFVLTHLPRLGTPRSTPRHFDKLVHAGLFLGLTLIGHYARSRYRSVTRLSVVGWSILYVAYAALDEWLQGFVGRTPDVWDWVADSTGVVIATLWILSRHRPKSQPSIAD